MREQGEMVMPVLMIGSSRGEPGTQLMEWDTWYPPGTHQRVHEQARKGFSSSTQVCCGNSSADRHGEGRLVIPDTYTMYGVQVVLAWRVDLDVFPLQIDNKSPTRRLAVDKWKRSGASKRILLSSPFVVHGPPAGWLWKPRAPLRSAKRFHSLDGNLASLSPN